MLKVKILRLLAHPPPAQKRLSTFHMSGAADLRASRERNAPSDIMRQAISCAKQEAITSHRARLYQNELGGGCKAKAHRVLCDNDVAVYRVTHQPNPMPLPLLHLFSPWERAAAQGLDQHGKAEWITARTAYTVQDERGKEQQNHNHKSTNSHDITVS